MKKFELISIIKEEIHYALQYKKHISEGLLDVFKKQSTFSPTPQSAPKVSINMKGGPVVEGISADGKGYHIWSGPKSNALGDLRQLASQKMKNDFGTITKNGVTFNYYIVVNNPSTKFSLPLQDHVGRKAYFTVSAPEGSITKDQLKAIADSILEKNKANKGIKIY